MNVDQLQADTSLTEAAAKCGVTLDAHGSGQEVRLDCSFGCQGDHSGRREIAVNTENPQKVFMCHAYQCGFRGNLLTLMHGWLTGTKPTGDKLKGDEYHRVKNILADAVTRAANAVSNTKKRKLRGKGLRFVLEVCRSLFAYAAKNRHLPPYTTNPFAVIQLDRMKNEDAKPIFIFTEQQAVAYLKSANEWAFAIHCLLLLTGLRPGELCHLLIEAGGPDSASHEDPRRLWRNPRPGRSSEPTGRLSGGFGRRC